MCRSLLNPAVKTALKSVEFFEVADKNKLAPFYGHDVDMNARSYNMKTIRIIESEKEFTERHKSITCFKTHIVYAALN